MSLAAATFRVMTVLSITLVLPSGCTSIQSASPREPVTLIENGKAVAMTETAFNAATLMGPAQLTGLLPSDTNLTGADLAGVERAFNRLPNDRLIGQEVLPQISMLNLTYPAEVGNRLLWSSAPAPSSSPAASKHARPFR